MATLLSPIPAEDQERVHLAMQASASDEVLKAPIGAQHSEMVSRDLWNVPTNRLINMGYLQQLTYR